MYDEPVFGARTYEFLLFEYRKHGRVKKYQCTKKQWWWKNVITDINTNYIQYKSFEIFQKYFCYK